MKIYDALNRAMTCPSHCSRVVASLLSSRFVGAANQFRGASGKEPDLQRPTVSYTIRASVP